MLKGTGFGWFLFCFLLSLSAITYYGPFTHSVFGANSYSYIMTKCKTEGNLSLSIFTVSYAVSQEVQTEYVVEFTMSDKTPFLSVDVAWLGNKTNTVEGKATVTVFSSLFSLQNGTEERFTFWDDPYYSTFFPTISKDELDQYTCDYSFNLTSTLAEAQMKFANKMGLVNASQAYMGTRMFFSILNMDAIREEGQERHVEYSFQKKEDNPLDWSVFLYGISFSIPDDSQFISEPSLNNIKMTKILKRVESYVSINYGDLNTYTAVAEWNVASVPPWWQIPPTSWLLSTLLGVFLISTPIGLATAYVKERRLRPELSIKIPQRNTTEPAIHPANGIAFYHLSAENNGKTTTFDSEMQITFKETNGRNLFSLTGRWDRGPEPLGPITQGYWTQVWPSLIPFGERVNIRPGIPELFCLIIKDNEEHCYAFNGESYIHNFKNPLWQLPKGEFIVEIRIRSGNADKLCKFLLKNYGNSIQNVEIQEANSDQG